MPAKETVLKTVKNGFGKSISAAGNFINNHRYGVGVASLVGAFAIPTAAIVLASKYDEAQLTAEQKALYNLQNLISQINGCLSLMADENQPLVDLENERINNEVMLATFHDTLKRISVTLDSNNYISCINLKNQIDTCVKVINENVATINLENKEFEKAFVNLMGALNAHKEEWNNGHYAFYDWFYPLNNNINRVKNYLNALRQAPKVQERIKAETAQKEVLKQETYNKLKQTMRDAYPTIKLVQPEIADAMNDLMGVVFADINNVKATKFNFNGFIKAEPTNKEFAKALKALDQKIAARLLVLDKSITPGVAFGTIAGVTLPLWIFVSSLNADSIQF